MEKKVGFFKQAWTSIKDFEKYEEFAADKVSSAIKYILILILIFTIVIALTYTLKFYGIINSAKEYISKDIEEIKLEDGKLTVSSETPIIIENENSVIPIIIIDTTEVADIEKYLEKINIYDTGILILKDKITISNNLLTQNQSMYYSNIFTDDIESKEEFINLISGNNMAYTYLLFFTTIFIYLFVIYLSSNLVDGVVLGVLGYLFARIVRLKLKFKATFNIGLHAMTLSILLNLIYIIVNTFTNFTITYFGWMYTTISYIYVAVAILMIKTEIINQKIQLIKLEKMQQQVAKEETINDQEPENKEKKEKEDAGLRRDDSKKEKEDGEQPEGSNA